MTGLATRTLEHNQRRGALTRGSAARAHDIIGGIGRARHAIDLERWRDWPGHSVGCKRVHGRQTRLHARKPRSFSAQPRGNLFSGTSDAISHVSSHQPKKGVSKPGKGPKNKGGWNTERAFQ